MGRKRRRVPVSLHPQDCPLQAEEIRIIIRGADDLIMEGGRSLLAKILKGSKDKALLEKGLQKSPVYGYYKNLTLDAITSKIDWLLVHDYLCIEYSGRLPMLVYSSKGWEIEKDIYTDELLAQMDQWIDSGVECFNMLYLKDRARDMIMVLLDKIQDTGDSKYIPLLEAWKKIDYKKVRKRIDSVIRHLGA